MMKLLYEALAGVHLLGVVAIGWGLFRGWKTKTVNTAMLHGASTQILTGVLMVGLAESGAVDETLDMTKIAIKLAVVIAMLAIVVKGRRATGSTTALWATVGVLWLANIIIAVSV